MKLTDWLPQDADLTGTKAERLSDAEVIKEYSMHDWDNLDWEDAPMDRSYMYSWCIVKNEKERYYAVGFNENPSIGWSFPIKRIWEPETYL